MFVSKRLFHNAKEKHNQEPRPTGNMQKIKVIELFAGYGSQHLALKRLKRDYPNFDYEVVAFCEIDKHAITAYKALIWAM